MRIEFGERLPDITQPINGVEPWGILLTYRDGTKAAVLRLGYSGTRWHFVSAPSPRAGNSHEDDFNNRNYANFQ